MSLTIIKQAPITSIDDIADLNIVDWSRTNGAFRNPYQAMTHTCSWLINRAWYTIFQDDMTLAPERADWPGWEHAGHHEQLGRIWWNYFLNVGEGASHQLVMSDAPDFQGWVTYEGVEHRVFGDIGQVSAQAFVGSIKQMRPGDLWISVLDTQTHIVIESDTNNAADLVAWVGVSPAVPRRQSARITRPLRPSDRQ